jgi:hypothetical protein
MEMPYDKVVDYKDFLMELTNTWRFNLLERTAQLRQAELQKYKDPTSTMFNQQTMQPIPIEVVVQSRKNMVREARQYVAVLAYEVSIQENY